MNRSTVDRMDFRPAGSGRLRRAAGFEKSGPEYGDSICAFCFSGSYGGADWKELNQDFEVSGK